jgi:apolipoprotein N-acyltransferase
MPSSAQRNLAPPSRPLLARAHFVLHLQALAAGIALALVFGPNAWSLLTPLPLGLLFYRIAHADNLRRAFQFGFWGGTGFFALHLLWLPVSFNALFGPVVVVPMLLLPFVLGTFWGLTAAISRLTGRATLIALPFAWVGMEYLRNLGVFGFTWGTLGYAFLPTPLIQVADLGGVALVSLLVAVTAAALAALGQGRWRPAAGVAILLAAAAGYGLTRTPPAAPDRSVLLVQGSVNPLDKAEGRSVDELELYADLTRRALADAGGVDLVVWPEGASPLPVSDPAVVSALQSFRVPAIIGAPYYDSSFSIYRNSAYGFAGAVTSEYAKVKLVPFGETFPLRQSLRFAYDPIFAAIGLSGLLSTVPGSSYQPLTVGDIRAGTYICYESAFPGVARAMVRAGANLLVNISNDAWFGRTAGAEQHFQMGRVRAIETRRYVARAGNDGITAVIDPLGRVTERFPRGAKSAFQAQVGLSDVVTPYVRLGEWVPLISALALAMLFVVALKERGVVDA